MSTTADTLAEQPFLAGLTDDQRQRLAAATSRSTFPAGDRIFRQGSAADQFWLITNGKVYLDSEVRGYAPFVLETLGQGDVLGWSWLFPPYRWQFGAVAISTTEAQAFDGAQVRDLCRRDPALGYELATRFLQVMGNRLQAARRRLEDCQRAAGHQTDL